MYAIAITGHRRAHATTFSAAWAQAHATLDPLLAPGMAQRIYTDPGTGLTYLHNVDAAGNTHAHATITNTTPRAA